MFIYFHNGEDIDIAFRRLAQTWYKVIKLPLFLNKFSALIPVNVDLVIDNGKWSLQYIPDRNFFSWKYIPIFKTWKYFNSFSRPNLPVKEFKTWDVVVSENKSKLYILKNKIINLLKKYLRKFFIK